jgi:hypothetical protein
LEVAKYKVLDLLNHSGQQYKPGDEIELSENEAKPLLAVDVIAVIPIPDPSKKTAK